MASRSPPKKPASRDSRDGKVAAKGNGKVAVAAKSRSSGEARDPLPSLAQLKKARAKLDAALAELDGAPRKRRR